MKTTKSDFYFKLIGYGQYEVTYTSPLTGKSWTKRITHMPLIDSTKNADEPTLTALKELKSYIKS